MGFAKVSGCFRLDRKDRRRDRRDQARVSQSSGELLRASSMRYQKRIQTRFSTCKTQFSLFLKLKPIFQNKIVPYSIVSFNNCLDTMASLSPDRNLLENSILIRDQDFCGLSALKNTICEAIAEQTNCLQCPANPQCCAFPVST